MNNRKYARLKVFAALGLIAVVSLQSLFLYEIETRLDELTDL